jgi:hypothetical protein
MIISKTVMKSLRDFLKCNFVDQKRRFLSYDVAG